jgi:hypothetical protein
VKVFFDCNVWLDVGLPNSALAPGSRKAFEFCAQPGHTMWLAWHTLSNVFYIMRKKHGPLKAERFVARMIQAASVATVSHADAVRAVEFGLKDFEDALQLVSAEACGADAIVTRNVVDFKISSVPVYTPEDFVAAFAPPASAP